MEQFDSCHSIWVLDTERRQFCRLPQGSKVDAATMRDQWKPYVDFEQHDDGARVLVLNESRTKLLRFWEHLDPCPHCATDHTEEIRVTPVEEGAG